MVSTANEAPIGNRGIVLGDGGLKELRTATCN